MNPHDNEKPGRKLSDYRQIKSNSVGYPIGMLPDNPDQAHLVTRGTNWEHVPSTLVLEALNSAKHTMTITEAIQEALPVEAECFLSDKTKTADL